VKALWKRNNKTGAEAGKDANKRDIAAIYVTENSRSAGPVAAVFRYARGA